MITKAKLIETIKTGIETQTRLELKVIHGLGDSIDLDFDPYIYGDDIMQHGFIWGFLPHNLLIYQFRISDVVSARLSEEKFEVAADVYRYYCLEEEHYHSCSGQIKMSLAINGSHNGGPSL